MTADDEFWSARAELKHVREFARARMASPWATLGCVLARVIASTEPTAVLPATVGSIASLNLFLAVVSRSGGGKGAATGAARDAVTVLNDDTEVDVPTYPLGSGEGLARLLDPDGDAAVTRAVLDVAEIDTMTAVGSRSGSTLMPELRKLWMGEQLGFTNAQKATRTLVPAHSYRACLIAGAQEQRAGAMLADADGGTPQRFLWMPGDDPDAPDIVPRCPTPRTVNLFKDIRFRDLGRPMGIPTKAVREIQARRTAVLRGTVFDPLDGHALLVRLKVAAGLALLAGRPNVVDDDWQLAGTIMEVSDRTRSGVVSAVTDRAKRANRDRAAASADRDEVIADRKVQRTASGIMAKLGKATEPMTEGNLRRSLRSDQRPEFGPAMDLLIATGQAVKEPGGYRATGVHVDTLSTPNNRRSDYVDDRIHVDKVAAAGQAARSTCTVCREPMVDTGEGFTTHPNCGPAKPCGHPGKATANGKCGTCIADRRYAEVAS